MLLPCPYLQKGVGPDDKEKLKAWAKEGVKRLESFNGIGKPASFALDIPDIEQGRESACQPYHFEAMRKIGDWSLRFMWRHSRGYEVHLFEGQILTYLLSGPQVAHMNWIKGASQYTYPHVLTCPDPNTMNFELVNSFRPMGPYACTLEVLMPISAPNPSSKPSLNRVDAFTNTTDASTLSRNS